MDSQKGLTKSGTIFQHGSTPSTSIRSFWDGEIVWVTPNDLSKLNTPYLCDSVKRDNGEGAQKLFRSTAIARWIFGPCHPRAPIGYVAPPGSSFARTRVQDDTTQSDFILSSPTTTSLFNIDKVKNLGEGTTFAEISKPRLSTVEPSLSRVARPEQTKIAEILSTVDRAIEQTEALIAKQQRIKTGLMQDLLTRGIDEHGNLRSEQTHKFKDSPLGQNSGRVGGSPILRTRVSLQGGYAFRSRDYIDDGTQIIRIGNLFQNQLSLDRDPVFLDEKIKRESKKFVLQRGDIIMSMTGTMGKRDYGFAVQIENDGEFLLNQRVCRFLAGPSITKTFFLSLLHSERYLNKLYDSVGGTKQANLNSSNILDIFVPFPLLKEQELIAREIESINGKISADRFSL